MRWSLMMAVGLVGCGVGEVVAPAFGDVDAEPASPRGGDPVSAIPDIDVAAPADPSPADTGAPADPEEPGEPPIAGGPGCGLDAAAFCATFDAPAPTANRGRAGELDRRAWSAGRLAPQLPTGNGQAIGIGPSPVPACRDDLPAEIYPSNDALICDATNDIASPHLLVIAGAQNYGQSSYRVRQPFDFAGRTGRIVFDAEAFLVNGLLGWISVELLADPINAPSFAVGGDGVNNDEGSLVPRQGFEVQLQNRCGGANGEPAGFAIRMVEVFHAYRDTLLEPDVPTCVAAAPGRLNHFELRVAEDHLEVWATPHTSGAAPVRMFAADVDLGFSRGWFSITTHNHAVIKYGPSYGANDAVAWTSRWDNVGFDGPVVGRFSEHEAPDSLTPGEDAWNRSGPVVNIGYRLPEYGSATLAIGIPGVDPSNVTKAILSLSSWYLLVGADPSTFVLHYRLNGGTWHERRPNADELWVLGNGHSQGQLGQIIDVTPSELIAGNNTLELATSGASQGYPPVVANIDLVLERP